MGNWVSGIACRARPALTAAETLLLLGEGTVVASIHPLDPHHRRDAQERHSHYAGYHQPSHAFPGALFAPLAFLRSGALPNPREVLATAQRTAPSGCERQNEPMIMTKTSTPANTSCAAGDPRSSCGWSDMARGSCRSSPEQNHEQAGHEGADPRSRPSRCRTGQASVRLPGSGGSRISPQARRRSPAQTAAAIAASAQARVAVRLTLLFSDARAGLHIRMPDRAPRTRTRIATVKHQQSLEDSRSSGQTCAHSSFLWLLPPSTLSQRLRMWQAANRQSRHETRASRSPSSLPPVRRPARAREACCVAREQAA